MERAQLEGCRHSVEQDCLSGKYALAVLTHNIQFDVTLFKAHEPLCMRPLSDKTHEGE